jgi:RNA polymerase sigma factor (sigma-70 family)
MEAHWIAGCRQGHRGAQEQLYQHYAPRVMGVCRRYATTGEDAKDIFQEAFINIYKSLQKEQTFESLDAWIRKVTANTAISYYHRHKKYQKQISTDTIVQYDDNNYDHILSELRKEELLQLIDVLPVGCKHIFNLYVIEGYTHKEIAVLMNISEGTSKSQLSRAKDLMKSKLNGSDHVAYKRVV